MIPRLPEVSYDRHKDRAIQKKEATRDGLVPTKTYCTLEYLFYWRLLLSLESRLHMSAAIVSIIEMELKSIYYSNRCRKQKDRLSCFQSLAIATIRVLDFTAVNSSNNIVFKPQEILRLSLSRLNCFTVNTLTISPTETLNYLCRTDFFRLLQRSCAVSSSL